MFEAPTHCGVLAPGALFDEGYDFDCFGANADWVRNAARAIYPAYRHYFRVESFGWENIPETGGTILASNHSGTLPIDGVMIWLDILLKLRGKRLPRVVLDHFVGLMPGINVLFARAGAVGGSRGNAHAILERGELLALFPEGVAGLSKPFAERYKLRRFRVGHAELAIRHQVPVVPTAVVGAEEQLPALGRMATFGLWGIPYWPLTVTPVPLPVKYRIYYGEPVVLHTQFPDAQSAAALANAAQVIEDRVAELVDRGLREREGWFL